MAKIMEHSWWENDCMACVAYKLYKNPQRLAWVGDYAEQDDFYANDMFKVDRCIDDDVAVPNVEKVWGEDAKTSGFDSKERIALDHKYLVNHEQKVYIDLDEYFKRSVDKEGWCINPISILTAVGNGRGGGDFHNEAQEWLVGRWAWNMISIEDEPPQGFEKDDEVTFTEE
jgi:hypothetical protein